MSIGTFSIATQAISVGFSSSVIMVRNIVKAENRLVIVGRRRIPIVPSRDRTSDVPL